MTLNTLIWLGLGLVLGTIAAKLEKWFLHGVERYYQRKQKREECDGKNTF